MSKKKTELDALYDKINKLMYPIMLELKPLEHHERHIIIDKIVVALFTTLCSYEKLGIIAELQERIRFEAGRKFLKEMAPDVMDIMTEATEKHKGR